MLPIFDNKKKIQSGISIKTRTPDEKPEENQDDSSAAIEACAQDLISAVQSNNVKAAAEAIKSAFEILESQPHSEGPHIEPHSYDASKKE